MHFDPDAPRPTWAVPEAAWFLALIGGFAATWAGSTLGIVGPAPVLAAGFATFYQAVLHRHRLHGSAGMVAGASILGVLVATVGLVIDIGFDATLELFPFAGLYIQEVTEPLYWAGESVGRAGRAGAARLLHCAVSVGFAGVCVATAGPTRGLVPLFGCAAYGGALVLAGIAAASGGAPTDTHVLLALHSIPPWGLLQLAGIVMVSSALASEEAVTPLEDLSAGRRRLLVLGAPALGLGLILQPFLAHPWGAWVPTD